MKSFVTALVLVAAAAAPALANQCPLLQAQIDSLKAENKARFSTTTAPGRQLALPPAA